ncbi:hypothetical protein ACJX0J_036273, partial [Zea mays]
LEDGHYAAYIKMMALKFMTDEDVAVFNGMKEVISDHLGYIMLEALMYALNHMMEFGTLAIFHLSYMLLKNRDDTLYLMHLIWFLVYAALDLNKYSHLYPLFTLYLYLTKFLLNPTGHSANRASLLLDYISLSSAQKGQFISGDCTIDSALNFLLNVIYNCFMAFYFFLSFFPLDWWYP